MNVLKSECLVFIIDGYNDENALMMMIILIIDSYHNYDYCNGDADYYITILPPSFYVDYIIRLLLYCSLSLRVTV